MSHSGVARKVTSLAAQYGVTYEPTPLDDWANDVARVLGDDVELDPVELLLVELQRREILTGPETTLLHAEYLRGR